MSGAFFARADAWDRIVLRERERLGFVVRLDADMMVLDVAYLIDRALRPADAIDFPTFAELRVRWGTAWATSSLSDRVNAPGFCADARKASAWSAYWDGLRARRARGANRAERAVNGARTGGERAVNGHEHANADNAPNGERAVNGERTGGERSVNVVGALVLEAPSTEHPAPALETDTAPVPVAVSPSKAKRKPKASAHQPNEDEREPWDDLLGAYAEIDTDAALRMDSGESEKLRAMALALLRIDPRKAVLRLRYLARGRGDSADYRREKGITGSPILRPSSTWCADIDEHAARWAKRCPEVSRAETDGRWRDPGWVPTRQVEVQRTDHRKPDETSLSERTLTVAELARQKMEARHAVRDHRHDQPDLRDLEGRGDATPRGVALGGR
jgi:hypothetical protein